MLKKQRFSKFYSIFQCRYQIIKIGNSKGIRLAKTILEKYHIQDAVELDLAADHIILRPIKTKPRQGWDAAFSRMHEQGDDNLLIDAVFEDENLK